MDPKFEFKLNEYKNNKDAISAASKIEQMYGEMTNTFQAIEFARLVDFYHIRIMYLFYLSINKSNILPCPLSTVGFSAQNGGRPNAAKVMVVVTDGESHDSSKTKAVIADCEKKGITRFGIAVSAHLPFTLIIHV